MNEEVNVIDINTVDIQELPSVLSSQFDKLANLENNVLKAVDRAVDAKNKAENARVKIGLFDYSKKDAIKLLQSASEGLAEGLITAAEAQKVSFEYQTKLTEITKFLFALGVSNLAMNRSVVRELELKLKGASEEEISDLARQELRNVIIQLKAQEDVMKKQSDLAVKVKGHHDQLESINRKLDNIEKSDEHQDNIIISHSEKLLKHDQAFEELQKNNAELEQKTRGNTYKIKGFENSLKQQEQLMTEKNSILDKKYANITKQLKYELSNLMDTTNKDSEAIKESISLVLESVNTQISLVKDDLSKVEVDLSDEIDSVEEKLISMIDELKEEILNKDKEVYNKLTGLKDRIDRLDVIVSKLGWRIGISVVAAVSLILNILQICGIF